MSDTSSILMTKEAFAKRCYGIYKLKWMAEHGVTLDELVRSLEDFIQKQVHDNMDEKEFHDYIRHKQLKISDPLKLWEALNIYGEDGKYLESFGKERGFYKSFNMFLNTDFKDKTIMMELLGKTPDLLKEWGDVMKADKEARIAAVTDADVDETPTNIVYCSRNCINQQNGYCIDNGVAIDNDGYCTGYQQK